MYEDSTNFYDLSHTAGCTEEEEEGKQTDDEGVCANGWERERIKKEHQALLKCIDES